jgi:folate-binding protein YgfZ
MNAAPDLPRGERRDERPVDAPGDDLDDGVLALVEGRAFVRPAARAVAVRGADAATWLNDLLTAGLDGLSDGASVRSLVLSPTGRIRADVHVLRTDDAFVLLQPLDQPDPVDAVLAPYVLSSAVEIGPAEVSPVLLASDAGWRAALAPPADTSEVDVRAGERWRIESGIVAFPTDVDAESLPAEAGLDVPPVTDTHKGCFLGQESVARVRNLGHPTRLVLAASAEGRVVAGEPVVANGAAVGDRIAGVVTSTAGTGATTAVLARVAWNARDAYLRTASGVVLRLR